MTQLTTPWGKIASDDEGCLTRVPPADIDAPQLAALSAVNDNSPPATTPSMFDRAMAAPCGPVQTKRRDVKTFIATEAQRVVTGARREAYGKPEDNFERIARFWQAYFENTGRGAVAITARDVSPLMRLMKEARLCESPGHLDSFVDIIGYAMTGAEVNGVGVPEVSGG